MAMYRYIEIQQSRGMGMMYDVTGIVRFKIAASKSNLETLQLEQTVHCMLELI